MPGVHARKTRLTILILVLLIDRAHQRRRRRQNVVDKDENGLFGRELDSFADDIDELADCQVLNVSALSLRSPGL